MKKHEQKYLDCLAKFGRPASSFEIAQDLCKTGRATLRNLKRLAADGYVVKATNHEDPLFEEYLFVQRPIKAMNER